MAKARMIKPDVRYSEKVASWPIEVRYFWVLLWGFVDDHGKAKDSPLLVKADCFPLDVEITHETVDDWLWLLAEAGVVARYEVDGVRYFEVVNWVEHQKPQHPKDDVLPGQSAPGAVRRERHEARMKPSRKSHAVLTPELSRDELGLSKSAPASGGATIDYFSQAYDSWPKKVDKADARKKWPQAVRQFGRSEAELVEVVRAHADAYRTHSTKQFTPALVVWLHKQRWDNELPTAAESKPVLEVSAPSPRAEFCPFHIGWPHPDSVAGCDRCKEERAA